MLTHRQGFLLTVLTPETCSYPKFHVLMKMSDSHNPKITIETEYIEEGEYAESEYSESRLNKFYKLAQLTKSSINSTIYAATGIKLDQKKLIVSFLLTLIKDFVLAYSVRASLKLIPRLLKMLQNLK